MIVKTPANTALDVNSIRGYLSDSSSELVAGLEVHKRVVSTNDTVLARAEQKNFACIANQQTGGKGRNGSVWESPANANIYMSLGYCFKQFPVQALNGLSLASGVCVARVLEGMGVRAQLKWPNDILLEYRKLAGILIETRIRSGGVYAVIGLGMNIDMAKVAGSKINQPWTDLCSALPALAGFEQRNKLAAQLLDALFGCCIEYHRSGFTSFVHDWHRFDVLSSRQVIVKTQQGERCAKVAGISEDFGLKVEINGVQEVVYAADVKLKLDDDADD